MTEPVVQAAIAGAALVGLVVVALAGLRAWHDWLDLQRSQFAGRTDRDAAPVTSSGARIELADHQRFTLIPAAAVCTVMTLVGIAVFAFPLVG